MRTLIMYHSLQGNTEHVAKIMASYLDAETMKINSQQKTFKNAIFTTPSVLSQSIRRGQFDKAVQNIDLKNYDRIILASPCWFYDITPPMKNLINQMNFGSKEIYFVITHGGDLGKLKEKYVTDLPTGLYKGMIDFSFAKDQSEDQIIHETAKLLNRE